MERALNPITVCAVVYSVARYTPAASLPKRMFHALLAHQGPLKHANHAHRLAVPTGAPGETHDAHRNKRTREETEEPLQTKTTQQLENLELATLSRLMELAKPVQELAESLQEIKRELARRR